MEREVEIGSLYIMQSRTSALLSRAIPCCIRLLHYIMYAFSIGKIGRAGYMYRVTAAANKTLKVLTFSSQKAYDNKKE
jgi:hypothetical protein